MIQRLKNPLIKNSIIYVVSDGISKSLSFLTLPIISFYLIPEQLGIASNFDVLQSIVMLIAGQAVVNAIPYFYYERSKSDVALLISNLIFLIIVINIILCSAIFLATSIIDKYLHIGLWLQLLTLISVIAGLVTNINLTLYRLEERPYKFLLFQTIQTVVHIILLLALVVFSEMGAIGKILSSVLTLIIVALIHLYELNRRGYIVMRINRQEISHLLKFGIPLLPHSLSFWIRGGMDKILLTTYCGLSYNGLYSMGLTIASVFNIFRTAFDNAYTPYISKNISLIKENNKSNEEKKIVNQTYCIGIAFLLLGLLMIGVSWVIIEFILSDDYKDSFFFLPSIIISSVIYSFYSLVIQFCYIRKKTNGIGAITFTGSCIQCLLAFLLIKYFGPEGLNISIIIGAIIIMIAIWWYSNKVYPLPWFKFR